MTVLSVAEADKEADLVVILTPDQVQRTVYANEIKPNLKDGAALLFGHGFNIRFGYITPEAGSDVLMVAPKGPGHLVRREFADGRGVPVLLAVEQDPSGQAWDVAKSYARALGGRRAGGLRTTFPEEPGTDPLGAPARLCVCPPPPAPSGSRSGEGGRKPGCGECRGMKMCSRRSSAVRALPRRR